MTDDFLQPSNQAPPHIFRPHGHYMVTGGTYQKQHILDIPEKRELLLKTIIDEGEKIGWEFEAWAVLPNHYHFIAQAPGDPKTLAKVVEAVHTKTAHALNELDETTGRQVWYSCLHICMSDAGVHRARLKFIHENPVLHGVADDASEYRWCSMRWFKEKAEPEFRDKVLQAEPDYVNIPDPY